VGDGGKELGLGDGSTEGATDGAGEASAVGLEEGSGSADAEGEGVTQGEGESEGSAHGDGSKEGDGSKLGVGEGGVALASSNNNKPRGVSALVCLLALPALEASDKAVKATAIKASASKRFEGSASFCTNSFKVTPQRRKCHQCKTLGWHCFNNY
jgi:hypothetical protein